MLIITGSVQHRFNTEREAYRRLTELQGTRLPSEVFLMNPDIPEAQVDGLILEYIDGIALSSLPETLLASPAQLATLGLAEAVVRSCGSR